MPSKPLPIVRTSERSDFCRCPQKWFWAWVDGYRSKNELSDPLWFGTGMHVALAEWYRPPKRQGRRKRAGFVRGRDPRETWVEYVADSMRKTKIKGDRDEAKFVDSKELGLSLLEGYLKHYGKDESWEFLVPEQSGSVLIPHPITGRPMAEMAFTFDGLFIDHSRRRPTADILETKNVGQINTDNLEIDSQSLGYRAFAPTFLESEGLLPKGIKLGGILYNFIRKSEPDDRPVNAAGESLNKDGSVSKRQPKSPYYRHYLPHSKVASKRQLQRLQAELESMKLFREGNIPIYKSSQYDCSRFCDFFEPCSAQEQGFDYQEILNSAFAEVDPYEQYRR